MSLAHELHKNWVLTQEIERLRAQIIELQRQIEILTNETKLHRDKQPTAE